MLLNKISKLLSFSSTCVEIKIDMILSNTVLKGSKGPFVKREAVGNTYIAWGRGRKFIHRKREMQSCTDL